MYHMSAYKIIHKQTDVVLLHFTIISSLLLVTMIVANGEVYLVELYMVKFSYLWQVCGFICVLLNYSLKGETIIT